ncbi:MAG: hypothetical protein QOE92_2436 [Chloroflexota bacterium]|jgi:hypothetical protein|nr:hypothetical protein [Chloroflexota bacterium]
MGAVSGVGVILSLFFVCAAVLWIAALLDLARATEMDLGTRIIVALALILLPPIGLVVWLILRAPRRPRLALIVAGIVFLLLAGSTIATVLSASSQSPLSRQAPPAVAAVGVRTMPYRLLTHCGIHRISVEGVTYVADPPLDDGNGNPPPGWDNPFADGTLTTGRDSADFMDSRGHQAHFRRADPATLPSPPRCF